MSEDEHEQVVRRSFEQQVELFTGEDALFARRSAPTPAWLGPLDRDTIVIDVACGAAHVAEQVAPHVRQVVGVDLTRPLLDLGAQRLRDSGIANVLLQEAHAADLPFVEASFDLVMCRSALHHFSRPDAAVAEMARVCRPGGRVVVADLVAPSAQVRDAFDELHRLLDPSHVRALLQGELAELVRSAVGPLTSCEAEDPFTVALDLILTEATDRDGVLAALRAELSGGPPTGFMPVGDADHVQVSFTTTAVQARRDIE
jgi:ubiquinone/menaquinone biosynthesis C-methylase UbiE